MPRKRIFHSFLIFSLTISILSLNTLLSQESSQSEKKKIEPLSKWSKQWLEEVVPYIITEAEREVFKNLPNEVERGKFIENFWKKRDPNPQTPENEFKLDYYKRIALANKFFGTGGIKGWRTDRGRIYILLGPPNEIQRVMTSSGSSLYGFHGPKEIWNYWGIDNPRLPYNLEFVFVDKFGTGNYVLDRGVRLGDAGPTQIDINAMHYQFDYMEIMAEAMRNPFEGLDKLKGIITTQVTYDLIPIDYEAFHLKGLQGTTYIPLSVEIPYSSVTQKKIENEYYINLTMMIMVSDKLGSVVYERSKDINLKHTATELEGLKARKFQIQTSLSLKPEDYKIHFLILDNFSGKIGTLHQNLPVPDFSGDELRASDILLKSRGHAEQKQGDTAEGRIRADFTKIFQQGEEMDVYVELYNLRLDPVTGLNNFKVEYIFLRYKNILTRIPSPAIKPTPEKDCRVQSSFRLKNFKPGEYVLQIHAVDLNSGKEITKGTRFIISSLQ